MTVFSWLFRRFSENGRFSISFIYEKWYFYVCRPILYVLWSDLVRNSDQIVDYFYVILVNFCRIHWRGSYCTLKCIWILIWSINNKTSSLSYSCINKTLCRPGSPPCKKESEFYKGSLIIKDNSLGNWDGIFRGESFSEFWAWLFTELDYLRVIMSQI